jgi:hypothetical protein
LLSGVIDEKGNSRVSLWYADNLNHFWRFPFAGNVGNLDTIFGLTFWRLLDVVYPVLSIVVFLIYGREKHGLKINLRLAVIFSGFLVLLALICLDDLAIVLNVSIEPPVHVWVIMEWGYPVLSIIAFFLFGKTNEVKQ